MQFQFRNDKRTKLVKEIYVASIQKHYSLINEQRGHLTYNLYTDAFMGRF